MVFIAILKKSKVDIFTSIASYIAGNKKLSKSAGLFTIMHITLSG